MQNAEDGIKTMRINHSHIAGQTPGNHHNRHAMALCDLGYAERSLAVDGLAINTPLSGNHQISPAHGRIQPHGFGHDFYAGPQPPMQQRQHGRAHPASRARPGNMANSNAKVTLDNPGVMGQTGIQLAHHGWRGAFLRPKNCRSPIGAGERIVDITRDFNRAFRQTRVEPCQINPRKLRQRGSAKTQRLAIGRLQAGTERLCHPRPPSLVALPPMPTMNLRAPASSAARISSPVP